MHGRYAEAVQQHARGGVPAARVGARQDQEALLAQPCRRGREGRAFDEDRGQCVEVPAGDLSGDVRGSGGRTVVVVVLRPAAEEHVTGDPTAGHPVPGAAHQAAAEAGPVEDESRGVREEFTLRGARLLRPSSVPSASSDSVRGSTGGTSSGAGAEGGGTVTPTHPRTRNPTLSPTRPGAHLP
ncbi:hypothetical protein [Streptomyces sp. NPDC056983]|uniref:hypothetical protein n=1 Tax=Streptomyces sp. NPDC056983 TaxID=3345987 RepID=UPI0036442DB8